MVGKKIVAVAKRIVWALGLLLVVVSQNVKGERLPSVASAPHIALGLLAHFYDSSDATDLCYRARIGRNKCRPLAQNGRKPLPLADAPRATTGPS